MSELDLAREVERVRRGDAEAWGEVYRLAAPWVFRLCRRVLPTREDAEDATAEVFLKARLRLDQYDSARPLIPWLYRIAANHCWDRLRRRRNRREREWYESQMAASGEPGPESRLLAEESHQQIRQALGRLGDRARMVLVMRYFAELSYEDIAQELGVTPSFVGVLLLRARRELRQAIENEEQP